MKKIVVIILLCVCFTNCNSYKFCKKINKSQVNIFLKRDVETDLFILKPHCEEDKMSVYLNHCNSQKDDIIKINCIVFNPYGQETISDSIDVFLCKSIGVDGKYIIDKKITKLNRVSNFEITIEEYKKYKNHILVLSLKMEV